MQCAPTVRGCMSHQVVSSRFSAASINGRCQMNCVKLSERKTDAKAECKVAFTGCKFARGSKVSGMRAWTFHARNEKFDRFNFEANCDVHYSSCMKRLRAQPRHLTRTSQLAWCKSDLQHTTNESAGPGTSTGFRLQSPGTEGMR